MSVLKLIIFICFLGQVGYADDHIVLILSKDSKLSTAQIDEVKKVYMGHPNALKLRPVMLSMSHSDTKLFVQNYLQMTLFEFDQYWLEKELSGQVSPPRTFISHSKMLEFLKSNSGYIGYIEQSKAPKKGFKTIPLKL